MKKKVLALVIAALMMLALVPVGVMAKTEEGNATRTDQTIFFHPNTNWLTDGARFAVWLFNGSQPNEFRDLAPFYDTGYYYVTFPAGVWGKIIFVRMNGSTTTNDWNYKWNQTADLTIPTDSQNCFTLPDGNWEGATDTWSTVHTVTFDMMGHGAEIGPQVITENGTATEPAAPTADNYSFGGWFKEDSFATVWDFSTDTVTADTIIYAKWISAPTASYIKAEIRTGTSSETRKSLRYVFTVKFNKSNLTIGSDTYGYQTGAEYTLTNLDAQFAAGNSVADDAAWHPLYNIFSFDTPDGSGNHPGFTFTVVLNGITDFNQNYAVRVRCGYTPISGGAVEYYTLNTVVAKVNGTANDN